MSLAGELRGLAELQRWGELAARLREGAAAELDANRCHRLLQRLAAAAGGGDPLPRVLLLGQCTLDYLVPELSRAAARRHRLFDVRCGGYDSVLAELAEPDADFVVLVPWAERFLSHRDVEAELRLWRTAWQRLEEHGVRFVQAGYDWRSSGALGHLGSRHPDGDVAAISRLNAALAEALPAGAFAFDLGLPAGEMGRRAFYDDRSYRWFKQPFSEAGLGLLAEHLAAALDGLMGRSRKALVTDLDNTLWGGEVGELGPLGIGLEGADGEGFLDFQLYLRELQRRGVVLAVCSKNEQEMALRPFSENPLLRLESSDFGAFLANWSSKSSNLREIARRLNLSLDSLVFVDDNLRECQEVSLALPEVEVIHLAGGPETFRQAVEERRLFETVALTSEDRGRTESYRVDGQRAEARKRAADEGDYLEFLQMKAEIAEVGPAEVSRAAQLLAKTNQFNLTGRRPGVSQIEGYSGREGSYVKALTLQDRFGTLGLISVLIALPESADVLRIENWVLSCRAFERTVEQRFFADLIAFATGRYSELRASFVPSSKNKPVSRLLPDLGFQPLENGDYRLELAGFSPPSSAVG